MRVVWDRPEARWLPSRFRFALFRLFAWCKFAGTTQSQRIDHLALAIDRDQSAVEQYAIAVWILLTLSAYFTAFVTSTWHMAQPWRTLAVVLMPFVAAVLLEIIFFASGAVMVPLWNAVTGSKIENNLKFNSLAQMAFFFLVSVYFVSMPGWVRPVAWIALSFFAMNGAAAVVLLAMPHKLGALEREYGGPPSAK